MKIHNCQGDLTDISTIHKNVVVQASDSVFKNLFNLFEICFHPRNVLSFNINK